MTPPIRWSGARCGVGRNAVSALVTRSFDPQAADVTSPLPHVQPWRGAEDEKLWFAWQRLDAGAARMTLRPGGGRPEGLPAGREYEAAMAWARLFMSGANVTITTGASSRGGSKRTGVGGNPCAAPADEFTLAWILERHVGLTETSQSAVRNRWLQYFPHREAVARRWAGSWNDSGARRGALAAEQRNVALLCVIEHMAGWTAPASRRARQPSSFSEPDRLRLQRALTLAYPSDECQDAGLRRCPDLVTIRGWEFPRSVGRSEPGLAARLFLCWPWPRFCAVPWFLDTVGARVLR